MVMKVYFTASSSGSRQTNRENYLQILETVKSLKYQITNPYYAATVKDDENTDIKTQESNDVFDTLRKQIIDSDCVIAEITVPSTSLGIQIEYALNNKIPVLCLYKKGGNGDLPLMIRDYKNPLLFKEDYTNECVADIIKKFLSQAPKIRTKFNMFISYELDKYLSYLSKIDKAPKSEIVRQLLQDKLKSDKSYTP